MAKFNMNDLLNRQSKNENRKDGGFEITTIPLDRIDPSSANLYGIREIEELAASIESMGLLHNLVVRRKEGGRYEIISGERRYRACKLLRDGGNKSFETIPAKVEDAQSDALAELKLIFANATARELTDYEKTVQAQRMKELFRQLRAEGYEIRGRLREIVADVLDVSPAQVGRLESVSERLIPEFKEELKGGNIGITTAYDASTLPEDQQRQTLEAYRQQGAEAVKQAVRRKSCRERVEETFSKRVCSFGGTCGNAAGIAAHVKNGNLEGCAGCCQCCLSAKDGFCAFVCEAVKKGKEAPRGEEGGAGRSQCQTKDEGPEAKAAWPQSAEGEEGRTVSGNAGQSQPERAAFVITPEVPSGRTSAMKRAAQQLRTVAERIPYDASCETEDGEEINMRRVCLHAATLLDGKA